jgi:hypothetical protein
MYRTVLDMQLEFFNGQVVLHICDFLLMSVWIIFIISKSCIWHTCIAGPIVYLSENKPWQPFPLRNRCRCLQKFPCPKTTNSSPLRLHNTHVSIVIERSRLPSWTNTQLLSPFGYNSGMHVLSVPEHSWYDTLFGPGVLPKQIQNVTNFSK